MIKVVGTEVAVFEPHAANTIAATDSNTNIRFVIYILLGLLPTTADPLLPFKPPYVSRSYKPDGTLTFDAAVDWARPPLETPCAGPSNVSNAKLRSSYELPGSGEVTAPYRELDGNRACRPARMHDPRSQARSSDPPVAHVPLSGGKRRVSDEVVELWVHQPHILSEVERQLISVSV